MNGEVPPPPQTWNREEEAEDRASEASCLKLKMKGLREKKYSFFHSPLEKMISHFSENGKELKIMHQWGNLLSSLLSAERPDPLPEGRIQILTQLVSTTSSIYICQKTKVGIWCDELQCRVCNVLLWNRFAKPSLLDTKLFFKQPWFLDLYHARILASCCLDLGEKELVLQDVLFQSCCHKGKISCLSYIGNSEGWRRCIFRWVGGFYCWYYF